jgi:hypothetical protein
MDDQRTDRKGWGCLSIGLLILVLFMAMSTVATIVQPFFQDQQTEEE